MSDTLLLVAILVVVAVLAIANLAFFAHELGWLPHGKKRSEPQVRRTQLAVGRIPAPEVSWKNNMDFRTQSPFSRLLKYQAHRDQFDVKEPIAHLTKYLERYRKEPTVSNRDDLVDVVNHLVRADTRSADLEALVEKSVLAITEIEGRSAGQGR